MSRVVTLLLLLFSVGPISADNITLISNTELDEHLVGRLSPDDFQDYNRALRILETWSKARRMLTAPHVFITTSDSPTMRAFDRELPYGVLALSARKDGSPLIALLWDRIADQPDPMAGLLLAMSVELTDGMEGLDHPLTAIEGALRSLTSMVHFLWELPTLPGYDLLKASTKADLSQRLINVKSNLSMVQAMAAKQHVCADLLRTVNH